MSSKVLLDLFSNLRIALQLLDNAVDQLEAANLHPADEKRICLGRAMAEVLEVSEALCSSSHELHVARATATRLERAYNDAFKVAVLEAQAFEADGELEKAIDRYAFFLERCGSAPHKAIVRNEMHRLELLAQVEPTSNARVAWRSGLTSAGAPMRSVPKE